MGIAEPFYWMERAVLRRRARRSRRAGAAPRIPGNGSTGGSRAIHRSIRRARSFRFARPRQASRTSLFFFFEIAAAAAPPPRPPIRPAVSRAARRKSRFQHAKCWLVQRWYHPIQNLSGECLLVRRIVWSERTNFGTRDAL